MTKQERYLVVGLETKRKIKELAAKDCRSMKSFVKVLIEREFLKISNQKD